MDKDLKLIKKHYGESMMHLCRELFSILFENNISVFNLLCSNFSCNRELYDDICREDKRLAFKNYMLSKVDGISFNTGDIFDRPENLFKSAGYTLFECKSENDVQSFRKYYDASEELCSFRNLRLKYNHLFFAYRDCFDSLDRSLYTNPSREDEYGASLLFIMFSKGKNNRYDITGRYNTSVKNPDSTFSNNLDNICEGLNASFTKYYGYNFKLLNQEFSLNNYVLADLKYYKYYKQVDDKYFGYNVVIIDGKVISYEHEKYILVGFYLIDLMNKCVINLVNPNDVVVNDIDKILVEKCSGGRLVYLYMSDNIVLLKLDDSNQLIAYGNCDSLSSSVEDIVLIDNRFLV